MNILCDAVILQYAAPDSAEAQACRAVLGQVANGASQSGTSVTILDRGGGPHIEGAQVIAFPSFRNATPAADAFLVQRLCDHLRINVFVSTGFTTPISVPTLQLLVGEDLKLVEARRGGAASWRDIEIAVAFSMSLICSTSAMEAACRQRFSGWADTRLPRTTEAPLPGEPCDDRLQTTASRVFALSRQAMTRDSASKESGFLDKWRRVREIQAAIEVS